jgi:four helix bundle protein
MPSTFKELRVWQQAMKLATQTYRATGNFPRHEVYGLSLQMRKAAVSIPSNIAEGKGRRTDRDFRQFLFTARGSLLELETQVMIAQGLDYLTEKQAQVLLEGAEIVGRSLSGLINAIQGVDRGMPTTNDRRPTTDV